MENVVEKVEKKSMLGSHKSTLDEKGRMNVPVKFRDALGDSFIISTRLSKKVKCLRIYTLAEWERFYNRLRSMPMEKFTNVMDVLMPEDVEVKQGRFLVPMELRRHARLEGELIIIGMGDTANIWCREEYDRQSKDKMAQAVVTDL